MRILLTLSFLLTVGYFSPILSQNTGVFTDKRDGHEYKWVKIGDQTWMAENLAYLPSVNQVTDGKFEKYCFYVYGYSGYNVGAAKANKNYAKYGVLYNWKAARENCPDGWHLPSDKEWQELERHLGMSAGEVVSMNWRRTGGVGKKLQSETGFKTGGGTNEAGFGVLPAGCRGYEGFESMGYCTYFWTSTPPDNDNGWRRGFCGDDNGSCRDLDRRYFGVSVRCVKD